MSNPSFPGNAFAKTRRSVAIANAFSTKMLPCSAGVNFQRLTTEGAAKLVQAGPMQSFVGHADTAALFSTLLNVEVVHNRASFQFGGDCFALLVGELSGPRLQEGQTTLPEGATIVWWLVTLAG